MELSNGDISVILFLLKTDNYPFERRTAKSKLEKKLRKEVAERREALAELVKKENED